MAWQPFSATYNFLGGSYTLSEVKVTNGQDPDHQVQPGQVRSWAQGGFMMFKLGRKGTEDVANWCVLSSRFEASGWSMLTRPQVVRPHPSRTEHVWQQPGQAQLCVSRKSGHSPQRRQPWWWGHSHVCQGVDEVLNKASTLLQRSGLWPRPGPHTWCQQLVGRWQELCSFQWRNCPLRSD